MKRRMPRDGSDGAIPIFAPREVISISAGIAVDVSDWTLFELAFGETVVQYRYSLLQENPFTLREGVVRGIAEDVSVMYFDSDVKIEVA